MVNDGVGVAIEVTGRLTCAECRLYSGGSVEFEASVEAESLRKDLWSDIDGRRVRVTLELLYG